VIRKIIAAALLAWTLSASASVNAQDTPRIWQGVYTDAQAARGKKEFESACIRCHGGDLGGVSAPALKGDRFMQSFGNGSVDQLYLKIRDTMPPNFGTSISDDAKIDVVSYILQTNGYPAGARELPKSGDELSSVLIVRKGEQAAVRDFTLVQTVGCLARGPNESWVLTNSAEPLPARDDVPPAEALAAAAAKPLGSGKFLLLHAAPHRPADHQGHKMEARGLIYAADPADARLTLTSLKMVGVC
jgi:mono/diheme cytochrome c family protein